MRNTNLDIYLIKIAFDNFQNICLGHNQDTFINNQLDRNIELFYYKCMKYRINPIHALSVTFDRHLFVNRKRKTIPMMLPSELNWNNVSKALTSANHYQAYKKNQDIEHTPRLSSVLLIALKTYFNLDKKILYQGVINEIHTIERDFYIYPYFNKFKEQIRLKYKANPNKNPWRGLLLLDGVYSIPAPVLLLGNRPSIALFELTENEYDVCRDGLDSIRTNYEDRYEYLQYLRRAVNKIKETEGLV